MWKEESDRSLGSKAKRVSLRSAGRPAGGRRVWGRRPGPVAPPRGGGGGRAGLHLRHGGAPQRGFRPARWFGRSPPAPGLAESLTAHRISTRRRCWRKQRAWRSTVVRPRTGRRGGASGCRARRGRMPRRRRRPGPTGWLGCGRPWPRSLGSWLGVMRRQRAWRRCPDVPLRWRAAAACADGAGQGGQEPRSPPGVSGRHRACGAPTRLPRSSPAGRAASRGRRRDRAGSGGRWRLQAGCRGRAAGG